MRDFLLVVGLFLAACVVSIGVVWGFAALIFSGPAYREVQVCKTVGDKTECWREFREIPDVR